MNLKNKDKIENERMPRGEEKNLLKWCIELCVYQNWSTDRKIECDVLIFFSFSITLSLVYCILKDEQRRAKTKRFHFVLNENVVHAKAVIVCMLIRMLNTIARDWVNTSLAIYHTFPWYNIVQFEMKIELKKKKKIKKWTNKQANNNNKLLLLLHTNIHYK